MKVPFIKALHAPIYLSIFFSGVFFQCSNDDDGSTEPTPPTPKSCTSCTYVVPENQGVIDGDALDFKPGDVICLNKAFKYSTLTFKNIVGTEASPITITNCDGTVNIELDGKPFNLKTSNSKFFRITGGDTEKYYGIQLSGSTANGVVLTEFSTNFEVDHIEVSNVGFAGIMAKTDPSCDDDATLRGNFTMRNISLHDNYIHDTGGEGFYIGHYAYSGYKTDCGSLLPHTIEGSKIYNNMVKRSGWDAIQLTCATKNAEVFANIIEDYAVLNEPNQQYGIILGGGTGGLCYGNFINKGSGNAINVFGLGDNIIHDNIILNAGQRGIYCDERGSIGSGFKFINNTIINPKTEGIAIASETLPKNVCINNIIVNPGTFDTRKESAYVLVLSNAVVEKSNNFTTRKIEEVKFVNANTNFHLQSSSPAINGGKGISKYNIENDFYKEARLKGDAYDIGASEH